jgi:hypothetical protein
LLIGGLVGVGVAAVDDPGQEGPGRVVEEVIAGEGLDAVVVAGQVGGGDGDELAICCCGG